MEIYSYTDARNNLKSVLDRVVEDSDVAIVTRKEGLNAVIMSKDHYDNLMETVHVLSSFNNVQHLNNSMHQLNSSETIRYEDLIKDE